MELAKTLIYSGNIDKNGFQYVVIVLVLLSGLKAANRNI